MKRKLDENDVPTVEMSNTQNPASEPSTTSFESLNLDPRLLQAVAKSKFATPTQVQAEAIPKALEGKDILAKSRTGSGKTAAYVLPTIQALLQRKQANPKEKAIYSLVLVPTRELADQVTRAFASFAEFCSKEVRALNLTQRVSDAVLNAKLQEIPDVVVSTPGRVSQLINSGSLSLVDIEKFVIDEADLVLSYGYEDDIALISKTLPKTIQTFLLSATLTPEVDQLSSIFCRNPVTINIQESEDEKQSLTQYVVKCGEEEKFLLIYVIFKLKLVTGKTIIFVADTDRCYRMKLYLEQYGIRSCVLNSELPVNTRVHAVEEFNKGLYDILIAADDQEVVGGVHRKPKANSENIDESQLTDEDEDAEPTTPKAEKEYQKDFGVSRGIDFQNVSCVLNFDLPRTSKSYTHRIGRTARAGSTGMALSFVVPREEHNKHKYTSIPQSRHDERVLEKIMARQSKKGHELTPYQFDTKQIEAFRYRMNDALRAVTRVAVREARAKEIKQELIKSEKLRKHFEDNPEELRHLRASGGSGGVVRVQGHMKHVPDYLMPGGKKEKSDVGFVSMNGDERDRKRKRKTGKKGGFRKKGVVGRRNDPLKTFKSGKK